MKYRCRVFLVFLSLSAICLILLSTNTLLTSFWQYQSETNLAKETDTTPKPPRFCQFPPNFNFCADIFDGKNKSVDVAKSFTPEQPYILQPNDFVDHRKNCSWIRGELQLPERPLSSLEANFPLAYVLVVHTDFNLILRLLAALYWPQNSFCIHLDLKANANVTEAIRSIANCYPNVEFVESRLSVYWGHPTILQAYMRCLKILQKSNYRWRYVQLTAESDFPLKTNREMVEILQILNGSLDTDMFEPMAYSERFVFGFNTSITNIDRGQMGTEIKSAPPGNVIVYKNSPASTLTREFIDFAVNDKVAQELYEWFQDTMMPEEHYWGTLMYNPHINAPGNFPGYCGGVYKLQNIHKPYISRYQVWDGFCGGKMVRGSCRFGVDHLAILAKQPELMAHKLTLDYQPAAILCLNQLLCSRTYNRENLDESGFNRSFYENLPPVRYQRYQNGPKSSRFKC